MNLKKIKTAGAVLVLTVGGVFAWNSNSGAHNSGTDDYEVTTPDLAGSSTAADYALIGRSIVRATHNGNELTAAEATAFGNYLMAANFNAVPRLNSLVDFRPNRVPAGTPPTTTTTTAPPPPTTVTTTTTVPATTTTTIPPDTTTSTTSTTTTTVPVTTTTVPAGTAFTEDFSSPASVDRFVWQQSHGGVDPFPRTDQPRTWHADHDMACGAPPTLREVHLHGAAGPGPIAQATGDNAFWCAPGNDPAKGHVMTSTALTAYGHIDFMPSQVFNNVNRICWDMNRSDLGGRKWAQVSIIPEAAFQAAGGVLDYVRPNLEGDVAAAGPDLPVGAFQLSTFRSETLFSVGDGVETGQDPTVQILDMFAKPPSDRATRYKHCLERTGSTTTLTVVDHKNPADPNDDDPWTNVTALDIPTGPVRVIFQDATYDSLKGDFDMGGDPDSTNTWHWDNVQIS